MKMWDRLSPGQKRYAVIGGVVSFLVLFVMMFSPGDKDRSRRQQDKVIKSVLTDANTRSASIEAIAGDVSILYKEKAQQQREIERLRSEVELARRNQEDTSALKRELDRLRDEVKRVREEPRKSAARPESTTPLPVETVQPRSQPDAGGDHDVFAEAPLPKKPEPEKGRAGNAPPTESSQIREIAEAESSGEHTKPADRRDSLHIPSGSIISGVLQTGLDAPTGIQASRNPIPVLLRVKAEAILPNQYRADVKECLAVLSGYGDLSSERAYLRGETLSCVRTDGGVIEARLEGTAIGEDGKAGLRGRLVSKQGQLVARAALAGFFQGASEAFDVNPVPVIATSSTGTQQYQDVLSSDALQGSGIKGASTALGKVADFYMKLADSIFPVIEVDGLRTVDVMLTGSLRLEGGPVQTASAANSFSYK